MMYWQRRAAALRLPTLAQDAHLLQHWKPCLTAHHIPNISLSLERRLTNFTGDDEWWSLAVKPLVSFAILRVCESKFQCHPSHTSDNK